MANPSRINDPRLGDPINPGMAPGADPLDVNTRLDPRAARIDPANSQDPRVMTNTNVRSSGSSTGVLIAGVVIVLALAAYFMFSPRTDTTVVPNEPAVTEPATPAPAPDAMAPAAPADTIAPAPDAMAPAAPADPAAPAPESAAPAPAEPAAPAAPAPAPAQ